MQTILAVDDEKSILELVSYTITRDGFRSITASNGSQALSAAREELPDAIVLDVMLPDMSGFDVCRVLKSDEKTRHIPIILVTAKTQEQDIVSGLNLGADDYVTKPFSPRVLMARIKSVLRRLPTARAEQDIIRIHSLQITPKKVEVLQNGEPVALSATEFSILLFLARHPGMVFSRQQIISAVNGDSYPVTERSIDVQILSIRKKLGEDEHIIGTVRGVGYRMNEEQA